MLRLSGRRCNSRSFRIWTRNRVLVRSGVERDHARCFRNPIKPTRATTAKTKVLGSGTAPASNAALPLRGRTEMALPSGVVAGTDRSGVGRIAIGKRKSLAANAYARRRSPPHPQCRRCCSRQPVPAQAGESPCTPSRASIPRRPVNSTREPPRQSRRDQNSTMSPSPKLAKPSGGPKRARRHIAREHRQRNRNGRHRRGIELMQVKDVVPLVRSLVRCGRRCLGGRGRTS